MPSAFYQAHLIERRPGDVSWIATGVTGGISFGVYATEIPAEIETLNRLAADATSGVWEIDRSKFFADAGPHAVVQAEVVPVASKPSEPAPRRRRSDPGSLKGNGNAIVDPSPEPPPSKVENSTLSIEELIQPKPSTQ